MDFSKLSANEKLAAIGAVLAIVMSWSANHAIGWAVLHGFFGWGYVVYYLFTHDGWSWF